MLSQAILLFILPAFIATQETIIGTYIFHRHGDRTAKSTPPVNLTDLGYAEVYESGNYYRNRYIASGASNAIYGISNDLVVQSQISVSSPLDTVLQNSATGFLQGLYPPVGSTLGTQTLRNGSSVAAPLSGYQLIPINILSSSSGAESSAWLQASTGCANAVASSNQYFYSPEYMSLYNSTTSFYRSLLPVVNGSFNSTSSTFKNAYTIFDLINVAQIHNTTNYNDSSLITPDVFQNLGSLANTHEFNLAYNTSSEIRGIAGMQIAAEAVQFLNSTIASSGASKIGVQFGAYGTFSSFFGLANLTAVNASFYGIADYASSMSFELFVNKSFTGFPSVEDLNVRFLFHNGSANATSPPQVYPLFGTGADSLSWADFNAGMSRFAVGTTQQWCTVCGNTTGTCAAYAPSSTASSTSCSSSNGESGLSNVDAGVIGAFVTVGVFLLVGALVFLFGGVAVVSKKKLAHGKTFANNGSA